MRSARYLAYSEPRHAADVGTPGKTASKYHPLTRGRFIYTMDPHRLLRLHYLARKLARPPMHDAVRSALRVACTRIA